MSDAIGSADAPVLKQITRHILSIQATQNSSERGFRSLSHAHGTKRTHLGEMATETILLQHDLSRRNARKSYFCFPPEKINDIEAQQSLLLDMNMSELEEYLADDRHNWENDESVHSLAKESGPTKIKTHKPPESDGLKAYKTRLVADSLAAAAQTSIATARSSAVSRLSTQKQSDNAGQHPISKKRRTQ